MDKIRRGSVTLSARSVGARADGGELLLIHGLNANMAFWHPVLTRQLSARRFLVMYDQRGHGRSDMPPTGYTSSELARDAVAVLDAYGVHRADIVAHSIGGTVALQLARLYPDRVRSLVLLDARVRLFQTALRLGDWPDFARWKANLGAAGERLHEDLALDLMVPLYLAENLRDAAPALVASGFAPLAGGPRAAERYRRLIVETTAPVDYQQVDGLDLAALRSLNCSVLAIYGSKSPFLETLTSLGRELRDCETRTIEDARHNFPVMFPAVTAEWTLEFLERRSETGEAESTANCPR